MMVSQLMQRLEKSVMSTMVPIRVITTFVLDLCASAMSMLLSERVVRSLVRSLLLMDGLRWGRNKERLIELASLLREVAPSVVRFSYSRWRAVALLMKTIKIRRDLIFIRLSSFAVVQVLLIRLEKTVAQAGQKPVARARRADSRTIFIPW
jgi:hypothetical protein